jgi:glycogen debranching enzyme
MEEQVLYVAQPRVTLFGGGVALVCGPDGQLEEQELQGFFAGDTRVLSTYRIAVNNHPWRLLGRSQSSLAMAQWHYQNPLIRDSQGEIPAGLISFHLRRHVAGVLHDDLSLHSFVARPIQISLTLHLDADFADLFEVRKRSFSPRITISQVPQRMGITWRYAKEGFRRGLDLRLLNVTGRPAFVGGLVEFLLRLAPGEEWTCCLEAAPVLGDTTLTPEHDPHAPESFSTTRPELPSLRAADVLVRPFEQGRADLRALRIPRPGSAAYLAAGVPWFMTLFGRDPLITSLMGSIDGTWIAEAALAVLSRLQATTRDDFHDAEEGKFPHEERIGEFSHRKIIPQSPIYYGTHDTPALFCLALWNAWRWSGDGRLLATYLDSARKALQWCDLLGDRDGDGLQEYGTRSPVGMYNQSWKDADDAIPNPDGTNASLPLALVELQGYLYAAKLAMAEMEETQGNTDQAVTLRAAAQTLRDLVEQRYWMEAQRFYALAFDGAKRQVTSVASNPGHLLWCGLPSAERAADLAKQFVSPELFSGWGVRTLSIRHAAYNALSYQRGAVWPHDTTLIAAGLWRYGWRDEASTLLRSVLEAAATFEQARLPELFCGFARKQGVPVPYEQANSPQAWAAAVPLLATQLFLGVIPDAPHGRCFISPWLPEWLPELEIQGISIGQGRLDMHIARHGTQTVIEQVQGHDLDVIQGTPPAPLWGLPFGVGSR